MIKHKEIFRILLIAFLFFGIMKCLYDQSAKAYAKLLRKLANGVVIRGRVIETKVSGNHAFGIVYIEVDSANVHHFVDTLKVGYYPYKLLGHRAEIYSHVPYDLQRGDKVLLESDKQIVTYCHKGKEIAEGSLWIITRDGTDDVYIKKNTRLK